MAVLLPGKFIFLAHPHTGSSAMVLALQDAFPEALDLRPHHMMLADVRGEPGAVRMEQISRQRTRVWDRRKHKRSMMTNELTYAPEIVRRFVTGREHVFSVVRNPYDFLTSCYVRRGQGLPFASFVRGYREDPYVRDGRIYYHAGDSRTVIRYERLQDELDGLMRGMDLPTFQLDRHNETPGKEPWQSYYTPEAYRVVNERFGDEFARFYSPRTE